MIEGDAIFLLFLVCSADLHIHVLLVGCSPPCLILHIYVYGQIFPPGCFFFQ